MKFLTISLLLFLSSCSAEELTYAKLEQEGIVSGFGATRGDPLALINRIQPIESPNYTVAKSDLYPNDEMCIGTPVDGTWKFVPISVLNHREIVNNGNQRAICFCPLAGLAIAVDGDMSVSGLLKYDTFVLYANSTKDLILPVTQETYRKASTIALQKIQMLTFAGILRNFPGALILPPDLYGRGDPYGDYAINTKQGIGHKKPNLRIAYDADKIGFHPKERVLGVGVGQRLSRIYPYSELLKRVGEAGGKFVDKVDGQKITIHYDPKHQWAQAMNESGTIINRLYSYIFAVYQHIPDIEIYRHK